jgi:hypothetical protein
MKRSNERDIKKAAKRIKLAAKDFEDRKISDERLARIVIKYEIGLDPMHFTPDELEKILTFKIQAEKKLVKKYGDDDHSDRTGFDHNPYHNPLGQIMQRKAKPMIRKAIKLAHWYIENRYGKNPFRYDSAFTKFADDMLKEYIDTNFSQSDKLKREMMHDIRDIVGFMQKEDIYYRARAKDFINKFVAEFNRRYPNGIELTEHEIHNLRLWDRPNGNPEVDRALPPEVDRA